MIDGFDFQPYLKGNLVNVMALTIDRFQTLKSIATNLETWADYPNAQVRKSGSLDAWFKMGVEKANALAIFDSKSGAMIGTTRYYVVPGDPDGIGIGYTFIDSQFRRSGQTNSDLKELMFKHAFSQVSTIWFHVLPNNFRSQAAVKKLGVKNCGIQRLHLTDQPQDYATFSIAKIDWNTSYTHSPAS